MTDAVTETEVIARVTRLTRLRLVAFIEAEVVVPQPSPGGPMFRPLDIARLELLCDLADDFALEGDALGLVMALIDDLHAAHQRLSEVARALADEDDEVRRRIGARIIAAL